MRTWCRSLSTLLVCATCGRPVRAPATPSLAAPATTRAATRAHDVPARASAGPVDPGQACARIFALQASGCPDLKGYDLTRDECVENMRRSLEDRGADARAAATAVGGCFMGSDPCDVTIACVNKALAAMGVPDEMPLRACADSETYGAVAYPRDQWEHRKGAGATHFSEVPSTKQAPIEVCGIPSEGVWLASMKCDDGSNPFHSADAAEPARSGNVGPGGRCNAIVDLYEVTCPERTYEVYIDAYVCPSP